MGLILFGAILVLFYVAKIFFPEFIVGVAEIPSVVAFGNFVDSHLWAYYLYHFAISSFSGYFYCCACCMQKRLKRKQLIVLFSLIVFCLVIQVVYPQLYTAFNYMVFVSMPFIMTIIEKTTAKETFISTIACFCIDILAQSLTIVIRDILPFTQAINSTVITILFIDLVIWRMLLYFFFNNKNQKESE